jgi:excisionase family DNA binding protein
MDPRSVGGINDIVNFTNKEALKILTVTKDTLYKWVKEGKIRRYQLGARKFLYDRTDVYRLSGVRPDVIASKTVIYCRIATRGPANTSDMESQVNRVTEWCIKNGLQVGDTYKDICPSLEYSKDKRPGLHLLLTNVIERKIDTIVMESPDRLSRFGYELFIEVCKRYRVKVMFMNDNPANLLYKEEVKNEMRGVIEDIKNMYDNRATHIAKSE